MFAATADENDGFRRMKTLKWMYPFFSVALVKHAPVHPCWRVLPVGFTWSLYLAQRVNEGLSSVGRIGRSLPLLRDAEPAWRHDMSAPGARFAYVNNLGIISSRRENVVVTKAKWCDEFEKRWLRLHKIEVTQGNLGPEVRHASRPCPELNYPDREGKWCVEADSGTELGHWTIDEGVEERAAASD